jgi:hypothetical protein
MTRGHPWVRVCSCLRGGRARRRRRCARAVTWRSPWLRGAARARTQARQRCHVRETQHAYARNPTLATARRGGQVQTGTGSRCARMRARTAAQHVVVPRQRVVTQRKELRRLHRGAARRVALRGGGALCARGAAAARLLARHASTRTDGTHTHTHRVSDVDGRRKARSEQQRVRVQREGGKRATDSVRASRAPQAAPQAPTARAASRQPVCLSTRRRG